VSTRSPEEAYGALQRLARADGRTTQQAFELYVHERFLARLANSRFAERLVLKGGMLLAALDARRATRDADMLARGIDNDMENLRDVVGDCCDRAHRWGRVRRRTHLAGHNPRGGKI
jgi:predicted nucleotidyltransferase component of viral defense system